MSRVQISSIAHFHPMTWLQAFILGIVQGLTEFLPVSSSAHLRLTREFLQIENGDGFLYFDLACHLGTLFALLLFLRKEIFLLTINPKALIPLSLALFPLLPAYFFLKPLLSSYAQPRFLGFFLLFTSFCLFLARLSKRKRETKTQDALWIGSAQAMALLPGISRSGSTIAIARLLGWDWLKAAKFSFLLSIPAILGGELLETLKFLSNPTPSSISLSCYGIALVTSFGAGMIGVRLVFWIYEKEKIFPVALYCALLGIFVILKVNG